MRQLDDPGFDRVDFELDDMTPDQARVVVFVLCALSGAAIGGLIGFATWWFQ
ncbi:hypothetical protein AB4037_23150 [Labrys sp. KB_33_2]|uniref:hypothetical protein n=1 Tax=Labrys sp. KB_33_2 TaxID=3237479 RepID=UPI003F8E1940